jgi:hypothetical protein
MLFVLLIWSSNHPFTARCHCSFGDLIPPHGGSFQLDVHPRLVKSLLCFLTRSHSLSHLSRASCAHPLEMSSPPTQTPKAPKHPKPAKAPQPSSADAPKAKSAKELKKEKRAAAVAARGGPEGGAALGTTSSSYRRGRAWVSFKCARRSRRSAGSRR